MFQMTLFDFLHRESRHKHCVVGSTSISSLQHLDALQFAIALPSRLMMRRSHGIGTASLPAPDGFHLEAITFGRGIQNYTCEPGSDVPAKAIGAVATLYDAAPFLPFGDETLALIPDFLVSLHLDAVPGSFFPVNGHHFFDASGVPVFDLGEIGLFRGKKTAGVAAPNDAFDGPFNRGDGAVDWLQLCAVEGSQKLKRVYRVETAGGKPPASCEGQPPAIQVEYATQYWFYS
jgi:hypothetical protein